MTEALAPFQLDRSTPTPPVDSTSPLHAQLGFLDELEGGFGAVFGALLSGAPAIDGVVESRVTITGVDDNDIALFISRPTTATGPLPGVLHLHGGGMVFLSAAGPEYVRFRNAIAQTGAVVIGVEFRNAAGILGQHPFPAGLNDCGSALRWVDENRDELGISSLTVVGESGGANLSLATALKAKRDGNLHLIDGVYAQVPYISGLYGLAEAHRVRELPSLVENDGYLLSCALMDVMATAYDPTRSHDTDPLCWPYHATVEELRGLPPHFISVNELDPLRDEGLAYLHKLEEAGVRTGARTVEGVCHAADVILPVHMADIYEAAVASIHDFVYGLDVG
jgi:acetyl esterase/lipase